LIGGRQHIKMDVGSYQKGKLKGRKPTSATLCKHKDGNYYIHIQIKDDAPQIGSSDGVIGVDLGRTDIAVTSDGDSWSGKSFKCGHCGWTGDADLNGAMNIAIIGAFVSKPRGSGLSCSLDKNISGLLQDSALLCAVGESPVTSVRG